MLTLNCLGGFLKIPIYNKDCALVVLTVLFSAQLLFNIVLWLKKRRNVPRQVEELYPLDEMNRYNLTTGAIQGPSSMALRNREWFET